MDIQENKTLVRKSLTRKNGFVDEYLPDESFCEDVFTTSEGGDWKSWATKTDTDHVHSVRFNNGTRWDEVNGWSYCATGGAA